MFDQLVRKCEEKNLNFQPNKIVVDFKQNIHNAAKKVFNEAATVGCLYYLKQSWCWVIQNLGFTINDRGNDKISEWLRMLFDLLLLPHSEVAKSFVDDLMTKIPDDSRLQEFAEYLVDTYISKKAKFPPDTWTDSEISSERLMKSCEAFHFKFNKSFEFSQPNILVFLTVLKNMQADTNTAINESTHQILIGERGRPLILCDSFKFHKCNFTSTLNAYKWRCSQKKCVAKLFVTEDMQILVKKEGTHNHEPLSAKQILKESISNSVKRKAVDDISEVSAKIFHKELALCDDALQQITVKDVQNIKANLYRARKQQLSPTPEILETQNILKQMSNPDFLKINEETFLLFNNTVNNIVCFSTRSNLNKLCESQTIFIDGISMHCAKILYQFVAIHVCISEHFIPLTFALFRENTENSYQHLLEQLVRRCEENSLIFKPNKIVVDYEENIHSAVRKVFNEATIVGCQYYLKQSWSRVIQNLGLAINDKDKNDKISKWLRLIFDLPRFPHNEVAKTFVDDLMTEIPDENRVQIFADYLVNNFISKKAKFPPEMWAVSENASETTVNSCKPFHPLFNRKFSSSHPNIFEFLTMLKTIQVDTNALINAPSHEFTTSERGRPLILCDGFQFYKCDFSVTLNAYRWRCSKKKCNAKIFLSGDMKILIRKECDHNHEPVSAKKLLKQSISNSLKVKAMDDISEEPKKILEKELASCDDALQHITTKDVRNITRNLRRVRKLRLPKTVNKTETTLKQKSNSNSLKINEDVNEDNISPLNETQNMANPKLLMINEGVDENNTSSLPRTMNETENMPNPNSLTINEDVDNTAPLPNKLNDLQDILEQLL